MKFSYKTKTKLKDLFAVHEVTLCRLSVIYGYSTVLYKISSIHNRLQCLTLTLNNLTVSSGTNLGTTTNEIIPFFHC